MLVCCSRLAMLWIPLTSSPVSSLPAQQPQSRLPQWCSGGEEALGSQEEQRGSSGLLCSPQGDPAGSSLGVWEVVGSSIGKHEEVEGKA